MWTLVFILFVEGTLESRAMDTYKSMHDCFVNREQLSNKLGKGDGYFPQDAQAICVFRGEST